VDLDAHAVSKLRVRRAVLADLRAGIETAHAGLVPN
jgi:hypothetical protein